nr:MAG TPA: putative sugar kinase, PSI-II, Sugar Kinase, Clostridium [Bacteriophage sp.]
MDYNIYAGLGGSFGGAQYVGTIRNATAEEALEYAYDIAVEKYEDYTFYDGVHSYSEVEEKMLKEDPECSAEDIDIAYEEEMKNWIDYYVEPTEEDDIEDFMLEYLD